MLYVSASLSSCSVSVIVGPIAKENRPRLPSGGGRTAGAFRGLLNQPSSDGEKGNAIGVVSFRRVMIEIVDMVVVPVVVAAMMTTIRASQPDQPACAIARRPRGEFPWLPDLARFPWYRLLRRSAHGS